MFEIGHSNADAFVRWMERREDGRYAVANLLYLSETGRLEEEIQDEHDIEVFLHAAMDIVRLELNMKKALREDGHFYLNSRLGMNGGAQ